MFGQVLATARELADNLTHGNGLPGAAQKVRADARNFLEHTIPALAETRNRVISFGTTTKNNLIGIQQQLSSGVAPASMVGEIHQMADLAAALQAQVQKSSSESTQSRDCFASDSAALSSQQVQVKSQLAGLQAERDRYEAQASALRHRLQIINGISIVLPIVKIADEIASLIQSSKSTEAQLDSANRELAQVSVQANQLDGVIHQLAALNVGTGQLVGGTQSLANVINLVASNLKDDRQFEQAANSNTALLFVKALQTNIESLLQTAA